MSNSCDLMDCSLPVSSVHGILRARILKWFVIPFSKGSSWPRNWSRLSCIAGRFFTNWATREEWVAILFSKVSSWPRDRTWISCIVIGFFTIWATREALNNGKDNINISVVKTPSSVSVVKVSLKCSTTKQLKLKERWWDLFWPFSKLWFQ